MFLNAKIHFLCQRAQKVVLKSVEKHKKSSLKVYFPLTLPYRKKYNFYDYIEYFYYLCDVEKEEPAGS